MKKLLLATKDRVSNDQYIHELFSVFAGFLEIDAYCWEIEQERQLPREIAPPDILVMGSPYSLPDVRFCLHPNTEVILLSFTFEKEVIQKLKSLPAGTETVTCFKYNSEAHQAAFVLHELGLQNLNLYINYPNNKNMLGKQMEVALYSGSPENVPDHIRTVIDLGPMHLSLNTILDISMAAGIMNDESLAGRIIQYCSGLSLPKNHTSFFFNNSSMASLSLKAVTDCIDYGMVILDQENQIINYNDQFRKMFKIQMQIDGKSLYAIPELGKIAGEIVESGETKNRMVLSAKKGQQLLMSKEKINRDNPDFDIYLVLLKDVTEISQLETAFQKQARKQGHVAKHTFDEIKHKSEKMHILLERCRKIASVDKPTLIVGESGTGKELFASSIHNASARSRFPFVAINCATIPENLLESELFGYEDGAFTGARKGGKIGLFQAANKGTLFLDEIGELSMEMQAKLLRVLEEREIMRVGGDEIISIDTRIIAATNRDLRVLVDEGRFRLDLYYRLNTLTVSIPPLRERIQDLPTLSMAFAENEHCCNIAFSDEVMRFFMSYNWPGNIRELRNCIEYMVSIGSSPFQISDLPDYLSAEYLSHADAPVLQANLSLVQSESERKEITAVLEALKRQPLGRRALAEALAMDFMPISEYRLRKILKELQASHCISFGSGRAGCRITENGLHMLRQLSK
ncbi:MAG: sigma-54 interaction domain-containing protein [Anaerovoracaceae bacterium]